jgi:hypothetical protein
MPTLPLAVDDAYTLWMYLDGRVHDFPTAARHGLGARLLDAALDLVDTLLQATYAPRSSPTRRDALARANQRIAFLRILLRGARERHYLSVDQSEHATKLLLGLGGRVGAWLREASKITP